MAKNLAIGNILINGQTISTSPFSLLAGDLIDIGWTVRNIGDEAIIGQGKRIKILY
jgi:hypothetical protein